MLLRTTDLCAAGAPQIAPFQGVVRFVAEFGRACASCPLAIRCTASPAGRRIAIGPHEALLARGRVAQRDPAWRADYRATRPLVERKIAHLTRRRHGGRRARVRGRPKVGADRPPGRGRQPRPARRARPRPLWDGLGDESNLSNGRRPSVRAGPMDRHPGPVGHHPMGHARPSRPNGRIPVTTPPRQPFRTRVSHQPPRGGRSVAGSDRTCGPCRRSGPGPSGRPSRSSGSARRHRRIERPGANPRW
jgi:Transposase DDE domain